MEIPGLEAAQKNAAFEKGRQG